MTSCLCNVLSALDREISLKKHTYIQKYIYRVGRKKRSNFETVLLLNYTMEKLQIWMV